MSTPPDTHPSLDAAVCERARQTRDARFDGRFFVAVTSTRIYCRPICPVQPPRPGNVRFYATAAGAEEAGFRPCLRCRPEAAPGTPAWAGTSATVGRALRLIAEGALDRGSLGALADRLGVGERYLRKLFAAQIGASPLAVAKTRRLHLAKQLLDQTSLPMTAIAEAAGYGSVRRFNAAFQETYGRAPGSMRRARTAGDGMIRLRLAWREPWHWEQFRDHLATRCLAGSEAMQGDRYVRTWQIGTSIGWLSVRPVQGALELCVAPAAPAELGSVVARVRRMFDLDAEPSRIALHLGADPVLAPLVARWPGLRLPTAFDPFEQAVRAVIGQQVSVKAAVTVAGRLVARLGEPLPSPPEGGPDRLFPTPAAIATGDLDGLGLTTRRADTLRGFAAAIASGAFELTADRGVEALKAALLALPGFGPWTAEYVALRGFGEPDAFPASDLGLLKAPAWGADPPTARQLTERAERWRPWRAYAAVYLWQSYADPRSET